MEPLEKNLKIPSRHVDVTREKYIRAFVSSFEHRQQPFISPSSIDSAVMSQETPDLQGRLLVSGKMADSILGGSDSYGYNRLSRRVLRAISLLPNIIKQRMANGFYSDASWHMHRHFLEGTEGLARIGYGDIDIANFNYYMCDYASGSSDKKMRLTDRLDSYAMAHVGCTNTSVFDRESKYGCHVFYPLANFDMVSFGLNIPHSWKFKHGHNKWLWREYASGLIGAEASFRKKYPFPSLATTWLTRAEQLIEGGILEDLLMADVANVYKQLPNEHTSKWLLLMFEIWARVCLSGDSYDSLHSRLI